MATELNRALLDVLTNNYGNAFYVLDTDEFEANYIELSRTFKKYYTKFNIAYSYKTNYIPQIVKIVDRLGGFAEVVSDMELEIALRSGVKYDHIIWNGPIKNTERVYEFLLAGGTVNIDSLYEINGIRNLAERFPDNTLNIGIRCNYDVGDRVVSRFGVDIEAREFDILLSLINSVPNIRLVNLQAHFAKRDPQFWTARAEGMLKIYDKVLKEYGIKPKRLDIGGGIYGKMPEMLRHQLGVGEVSYEDYAMRSAKLFAEHFKNDSDAPFLFIEPGSALAGNCMRFVSKVETIKAVRGKTFATVCGSQKNISMSGINPPMDIVAGGGNRIEFKNADIVGFTCIEGDILQKNYSGELGVGDYVIIGNCGSYSLVMKPPFILPNFPVLNISGTNVEVVKRAETFEDLFHTYVF